MAILSTGQGENDPNFDYVSDVFTGPRKEGYAQNMAVNYIRHATELNRMSEEEIANRFNRDLARAVRFLPDRSKAARKLVEMHKRHGLAVCTVLQQQIQEQAASIVNGGMEETSMLAMVTGRKHLEPSWRRYGDRIIELLDLGIPVACKTHKPRNEPHLQEICDGILKGYDPALVREFPFLRWSSVLTKPDWSAEFFQLWIELKYVRKKANIHPITEAIAADITKYGDNQRRVLYIIYDPYRFIVDKRAFAEPIHKRDGMRVHFLL